MSLVLECQTGGSDTNGGGYNSGASGTDYSTTASKRVSPTFSTDISTTDAVAAGTTTITSATANFGTTIVGNLIYFSGGTGAITVYTEAGAVAYVIPIQTQTDIKQIIVGVTPS